MQTFVHLKQCAPWVCFWGSLLYIFIVMEWLCNCTCIIFAFIWICFYIIYWCLHWLFLYFIQPNNCLYLILGFLFCISTAHGLLRQCLIVTFVFVLICSWILNLCFCNMFVYFIISNPWLNSILGRWVCVFTYLLCHCWHPRWHKLNLVYWHLLVWIYHLSLACIETNIFIPTLLLSHIFISLLGFSVVSYS